MTVSGMHTWATNGASGRPMPRRDVLRQRLRAYRLARQNNGTDRPPPRVAFPSFFTLLNLLCGFLALTQIHDGAYMLAGGFILLAALFDVFDGFMARWADAQSPFGVALDSLSDVVSFGVAPGYLVYVYSLHELGVLGMIVAALPALCGAVRLARYTVNASTSTEKKGYFDGLPIPAQAIVLVALMLNVEEIAWFTAYNIDNPPVLATVVAVLAGLMVSTIRFDAPPAPSIQYMRRHPQKVAWYGIGGLVVIALQQVGLLLVLASYLVHGIGRTVHQIAIALMTPIPDEEPPVDEARNNS